MRLTSLVALSLVSAVASLAASGSAAASGSQFVLAGNAITLCRGALPAYESGMRSRPLAIVNEGARASFVNCGLFRQANSYGFDKAEIVLGNLGTTSVTVRCTGIGGVEGRTGNTYVAKQVTVAPGALVRASWSGADLGGNPRLQSNISLQCLLPPMATITEIEGTFRHSN